jgi:hypothetical protein
MDPLHMNLLSSTLHNDLARSALPNAPVVIDSESRVARGRSAAAGLLRRLADVVAPDAQTPRPTLTAGRGSLRSRWDESPCRPSPTVSA